MGCWGILNRGNGHITVVNVGNTQPHNAIGSAFIVSMRNSDSNRNEIKPLTL